MYGDVPPPAFRVTLPVPLKHAIWFAAAESVSRAGAGLMVALVLSTQP